MTPGLKRPESSEGPLTRTRSDGKTQLIRLLGAYIYIYGIVPSLNNCVGMTQYRLSIALTRLVS